MKRYAVIVAGGSGTRMGGEIPKQFLPLRHRPVLMYTLEAFHHFDTEIDIILVLPAAQFSYWTKLCQQHSFSVPFRLTAGGTTRFHSVRNGLERINAHDGIVGIHDGVRPLVSPETLGRCYREAEKNNSAIPVVPVIDSLRLITGTESQGVQRSDYRSVQTPQCFRYDLLYPCYKKAYREDLTDDASVFEAAGYKVNLVNGNPENIKITTPKDLRLAGCLLD